MKNNYWLKNKAFVLIVVVLSIMFLSACAPKVKLVKYLDPQVMAIPMVKDSIKASLKVRMMQEGEMQEVKATIFCVPYLRYRLELRGPMGVSLASLLWKKQDWTLLLPRNTLYHKGEGYVMDIENPAFPQQVDFHRTFAMLWGDLLPVGWENAKKTEQDSLVELSWKTFDGSEVKAIMHKKKGFIKEVIQGNSRIIYSDYQAFDDEVLPSKMKLYIDESFVLGIDINSVDKRKTWKDKVWKITIPEDFREF